MWLSFERWMFECGKQDLVGVSGGALEVVFCFWEQVGASDGKKRRCGSKDPRYKSRLQKQA